MRVLIIGAGLGGLCLAHGLRGAGVDVRVFERRPTPADQPASYGIHLNADGLRALHACLPAENWEQLVRASSPARDIVRFWDPKLEVLGAIDRETPENAVDPITRRRAVRRDALRDALLLGLDTVVQWGKELVAFERVSNDEVKVDFADGTSAIGDLLVGADASNSRVRKQRLPGVDRIDLGVLNTAGRIPLTKQVRDALPPTLTDGSVNNIVPAGSGWMFVSTWESSLVWAWAAAETSYPAGVDGMPMPAVRDHILERIRDWAPAIRRIVAETKPETMARIELKTMPTLESWRSSNVTLLGDAIHNMTPMAGIGANTALRDAEQLRAALVASGSASVVERVAAYEKAMRVYANAALKESTMNALNAASDSAMKRATFRTLLRIGEALPPFKRMLFGPQANSR